MVGAQTFTHLLWNGCANNPCSPQGGTWQSPRAGWCPGDKVRPWDNDITSLLTPGQALSFDYNIEEYFNPCNPTNPNCIPGQTCADCNYNGTTPPNWKVMGQVIFYRADPTAAPAEVAAARVRLGQNHPNPFNPSTTFAYELAAPGEALPTGVYFYEVETAGQRQSRKMLLLQ